MSWKWLYCDTSKNNVLKLCACKLLVLPPFHTASCLSFKRLETPHFAFQRFPYGTNSINNTCNMKLWGEKREALGPDACIYGLSLCLHSIPRSREGRERVHWDHHALSIHKRKKQLLLRFLNPCSLPIWKLS